MSKQIQSLMEETLKTDIKFYKGKYLRRLEKMGWTEDDLISDIREQVWKGILSFDTTKPAKLKTWLIRIIDNRLNTLVSRSMMDKHNIVDYYGDVHSVIDRTETFHEDTGEALYEARQQIGVYLSHLSNSTDSACLEVYGFLIQGLSLAEMVETYNDNRLQERKRGQPAPTPVSRIQITRMIIKVQDAVQKLRKQA